jgi:DNA repair protein RecO (recombination protein O)
MSEIIKTEAIVLSKMKYSDTSFIVSLFTKDYGRLSVIIKGGRSPKSKIGLVADPPNYLQVILYKKDTRELQILTSADLISYYSKIRDDFEKLKYSFAIIELVKNLTAEHEVNKRLFNGTVKILSLIESSNEAPIILLGRFFMFLLSEIGYEVSLNKCSVCGRTNLQGMNLGYNFEIGIFCNECRTQQIESFTFSPELFNYLFCLKYKKKISSFDISNAERSIIFFEEYLKFHVPDFKGIQSMHLLK